jgi:hypothetical protein
MDFQHKILLYGLTAEVFRSVGKTGCKQDISILNGMLKTIKGASLAPTTYPFDAIKN